MVKQYHIEYRKFARLYLLFPIVFFFTADPGLWTNTLYTTVIGTGISIGAFHLLYKKWGYRMWVLSLSETEIETTSIFGKKERTNYKELAGPMEISFGFMRLYFYSQANNKGKYVVIPNWLENIDDCLHTIGIRLGGADDPDHTDSDSVG